MWVWDTLKVLSAWKYVFSKYKLIVRWVNDMVEYLDIDIVSCVMPVIMSPVQTQRLR